MDTIKGRPLWGRRGVGSDHAHVTGDGSVGYQSNFGPKVLTHQSTPLGVR